MYIPLKRGRRYFTSDQTQVLTTEKAVQKNYTIRLNKIPITNCKCENVFFIQRIYNKLTTKSWLYAL